MLVIPAVDILGGHCVRLEQGEVAKKQVFEEAPPAYAARFADLGARRIHVVDLDAAMSGDPVNKGLVREIVAEVGNRASLQVGGGMRNMDSIESYVDMGVQHVVIGTMAIENHQFLRDACAEFGEQIILSIDARDGMIATHGWKKITKKSAAEFVAALDDHALGALVYTDIGKDGTLAGPNVKETAEIARRSRFPVIASGGVRNLDDLKALSEEAEGIAGAIIGKALYEEGANIADLIAWARHAPTPAA